MEKLKPQPGIYRHFKGGRYELLGFGRFDRQIDTDKPFSIGYHSEDLNKLKVFYRANGFIITPQEAGIAGLDYVVYKALYFVEHFGRNSIWVRPLEMFLQTVKVDGKEVPRFEFIGNENEQGTG